MWKIFKLLKNLKFIRKFKKINLLNVKYIKIFYIIKKNVEKNCNRYIRLYKIQKYLYKYIKNL